jgi:deoxyadenosine/deoxycytidine kinase
MYTYSGEYSSPRCGESHPSATYASAQNPELCGINFDPLAAHSGCVGGYLFKTDINTGYFEGATCYPTPPKKIISLEGNIGAGKSTLEELLELEVKLTGAPDVPDSIFNKTIVIPECVDTWKAVPEGCDKSPLQALYDDIDNMSDRFQQFTLFTRVERLHERIDADPNKTIIIVERSIVSDYEVFAKHLRKTGNKLHWHIYDRLRKYVFANEKDLLPQAYIYLRVSPATAFARIQERGREEEKKIPLLYIEDLHVQHEEWIKRIQESGVPVLILDGEPNFLTSSPRGVENSSSLISQIKEFIGSL